MHRYNYRMNRATFGVLLAAFVAVYTVLVLAMTKPPALAEVIVAFIAIPRLHDIGRTGWWLLTLLAGEILAVAIGWPGGVEGIQIAAGLYVLLALILLVILGLVPGEAETNRWGAPPAPGVRLTSRNAASDSE